MNICAVLIGLSGLFFKKKQEHEIERDIRGGIWKRVGDGKWTYIGSFFIRYINKFLKEYKI